MNLLRLVVMALLMGIAAAQTPAPADKAKKETPKFEQLTADEIRELRELEVDLLQAREGQHQADENAAKAREAVQGAIDRFNAKIGTIYSTRKITPQEVAICDGTIPGELCANGKPHDLRLVAVPPAKEESKH